MESIKVRQFLYLCGTSFACSLIFGLMVHDNLKDAGKMSVAAVFSSVAAFWVVKREDLQEKFEAGLVEASHQVKNNIDKVKNKIQGQSGSSVSSTKAIASKPPRKAISSQSPRKALPDRQNSYSSSNAVVDRDVLPETAQSNIPFDKANPVDNLDLPLENVASSFPEVQNQQSEPEYDTLVGQLEQLQEKNSGLKSQLQELQQQNQDLQTRLKLSDEQRQEWNQAFESFEQSELLQDRPSSEDPKGLEDLFDKTPLPQKQNAPENKENFEDDLTQFSQTLQTPPPKSSSSLSQPPAKPKVTITQEELSLQEDKDSDEFSDELASELDDLVGEDSLLESGSQLEELDELPSELALELEDIVVEEEEKEKQKTKQSTPKQDEVDLMSQLSQDLELSDLDSLSSNTAKKSILSDEQAELEQLFGQTPDRKES